MTFQPYLIANYHDGLDKSLEPWLIPQNAFSELENCYIRRGIVHKRNGTSVFGQVGNLVSNNLVAGNTNYAGTLAVGNGIVRKSVIFSSTGQLLRDNGQGVFIGNGTGNIDYATGNYNITFQNPTVGTLTREYHTVSTRRITGLFTYERNGTADFLLAANGRRLSVWDVRGFFKNIPLSGGGYEIFNSDNLMWFDNYADYCWMTNFDPLTGIKYFDGSVVRNLTMQTTSNVAHKVLTSLIVIAYRDRLLLLNTKEDDITGAGINYPQRARWSQSGNPLIWREDVIGQGGYVDAPTNDEIVSCTFIKDTLFVYFENSVWALRYTGNPDLPFRWDLVSDTKSCNATFGTIRYDKFATALGKKALFALDGAQTYNVDKKIPDFVLDINQKYANKVFGAQVNRLEQSWTCYPLQPSSQENNKVLVYSIEDDAYSNYDLSITYIGDWTTNQNITFEYYAGVLFNQLTGLKWGDQSLQEAYPIKLGGSENGFVMHIENESSATDAIDWTTSENFGFYIKTGQLNPFIGAQKCNLGYVDFLFKGETGGNITINFYKDDSDVVYKSKIIDIAGEGQDKVWRRVHVNQVGKYHQIEIMLNEEQIQNDLSGKAQFELHAMRLWFKPAGRFV